MQQLRALVFLSFYLSAIALLVSTYFAKKCRNHRGSCVRDHRHWMNAAIILTFTAVCFITLYAKKTDGGELVFETLVLSALFALACLISLFYLRFGFIKSVRSDTYWGLTYFGIFSFSAMVFTGIYAFAQVTS